MRSFISLSWEALTDGIMVRFPGDIVVVGVGRLEGVFPRPSTVVVVKVRMYTLRPSLALLLGKYRLEELA